MKVKQSGSFEETNASISNNLSNAKMMAVEILAQQAGPSRCTENNEEITNTIDDSHIQMNILRVDIREEISCALKLSSDERRDSPPRQVLRPKVRFGTPNPERTLRRTLSRNENNISTRTILSKSKYQNQRGTTGLSVFERLWNAQTIASLQRKTIVSSTYTSCRRSLSAPPLRNRNDAKLKSITTKKKRVARDHMNLVSQCSFDRLAGAHTALSSIRRKREFSPMKDFGYDNARDVRREKKLSNPKQKGVRRSRSLSRARTPMQRWKSSLDVMNANARRKKNHGNDDETVSVGNEPPLFIEFSCRMKIISCNTHRPEEGDVEIDSKELGIASSLLKYELCTLSSRNFAAEIVRALFMRDLSSDVEWNVSQPLERELSLPIGEKGYSFFIEASNKSEKRDGKRNSKNITSVSATSKVIFIYDELEILVENYSFVEHEQEI